MAIISSAHPPHQCVCSAGAGAAAGEDEKEHGSAGVVVGAGGIHGGLAWTKIPDP